MLKKDQKHWYAMRDLKRRNAKEPAYLMLKDKVAQVYTPMVKRTVVVRGKRQVIDIPFVADLLFVYDSRAVIDPIVERTRTLQYRFARGGAQGTPIVVRDEDMESFMAVTQGSEPFKYYSMEEVSDALCGKDIVIVGGELDGCRGKLMTVRGTRKKRLVVSLGGLLAAGVLVEPDFIRLADETESGEEEKAARR